MSNKIIAFAFVASVLTVYACKTKKLASETAPAISVQRIQDFWEKQFEGEYVEARGKATITMNGKTNNVAMNIKMKMDSIIWAKFSMFGIGATVLVTPDSFFMINSLNQEYMAYDNNYLYQYLGYKATIRQVQNLLLGNAVFDQQLYTYQTDSKQLKGSEGLATNVFTINDKNRTFRSYLTTADTTQTANFQYDTYQYLDSKLVPTIVNISIQKSTENINVVLNYQTISSNPIATFPFKIPNGYLKK